MNIVIQHRSVFLTKHNDKLHQQKWKNNCRWRPEFQHKWLWIFLERNSFTTYDLNKYHRRDWNKESIWDYCRDGFSRYFIEYFKAMNLNSQRNLWNQQKHRGEYIAKGWNVLVAEFVIVSLRKHWTDWKAIHEGLFQIKIVLSPQEYFFSSKTVTAIHKTSRINVFRL